MVPNFDFEDYEGRVKRAIAKFDSLRATGMEYGLAISKAVIGEATDIDESVLSQRLRDLRPTPKKKPKKDKYGLNILSKEEEEKFEKYQKKEGGTINPQKKLA